MLSALQLKKREQSNNRRKYKRTGSCKMAETQGRNSKIDRFRKQIFIGYGKEIRHK